MDDEYQEEKKWLHKLKEQPAVPIGLLGLTGVVGYSLYNLRKRNQKLSLYLIHTRVVAQGTLISCMTIGVLYAFFNKNWNKLFPAKKD